MNIPTNLIGVPVYFWTYEDHARTYNKNNELTTDEYIDELPLDNYAKSNLYEFFNEIADTVNA